MRERKNWGRIAGLILHILVGGLMLFTGSEKVLGLVPAQALAKYGLGERLPTPHSAHVFTRHLANEFILGRRDLHPHGLRRALSCASGTAWDVVGRRVSAQPRNARQIFEPAHKNTPGDGSVATGRVVSRPATACPPALRQQHGDGACTLGNAITGGSTFLRGVSHASNDGNEERWIL
jgi:hypothetical protein